MDKLSEPIVYVVDDDEVVRKFMAFMLSDAGLQTESFESAEDFLKRAVEARHGCLLLDVQMSGVTGMELLESLADQGSDLPVIMVTGHGHIPMSVEAVKLGAVNFFEKPFESDALVAAVRDAFEISKARQKNRLRLSEIEKLLEPLSPSEREVLAGLVAGKGHREIADELSLSLRSIEYRKSSIGRKMGSATRADLVSTMREYDELKAKCQQPQRLS